MAVVLLLGFVSAAAPARADGGTCVSVHGAPDELGPELLASFGELLRRHAATQLLSATAECRVRLVVVIDASSEPIVLRAHAEPDDGQDVVRLVGHAATPALTREIVAHAMYGSVSPWLDPVAPAPKPAPAKNRVTTLTVRTGLGAGGVWANDSTPDARLFGNLALIGRAPRSARIALEAGGSFARDLHPRSLGVERRAGFARLAAGAALLDRGRVELSALASLGVDLLAVSALSDPARYDQRVDSRAIVPSSGGQLVLSVAVSGRTRLALAGGIDIAWRRLRYVASGEQEASFLMTPRVLPFLHASLVFDAVRVQVEEVAP